MASFSTTPEIFNGKLLAFESGFHPENYVKALVTHKVGSYFINSLIYTLITCSVIVFIAAPAAYVLARFKFKLNKLIQVMFMAGMSIPMIMIIMPLFGIISRVGLTNQRGIVIILFLGIILPFTSYYLLTFFKNISSDFAEAAAIDGCGPIKTFWLIMYPLAQPGIITVTIFNFITVWNEYFISLIFANDPSLRPVAVGLFNMINSMKYIGDWAWDVCGSCSSIFANFYFVFIFVRKNCSRSYSWWCERLGRE